eukprot:58467-Pyramimonas_sp.AAC.1
MRGEVSGILLNVVLFVARFRLLTGVLAGCPDVLCVCLQCLSGPIQWRPCLVQTDLAWYRSLLEPPKRLQDARLPS